MKHFVVIAGNIAAGKTTLTTLLCRQLGWEPFLRLVHHRQLLERPNSVVQDRSVYEDAEIFAHNLFLQGKMSERDYRVYRELYEALVSILPPPDLVIYLRASVPQLQARIIQRGRDFEQEIDPAYLSQLDRLYEEWISNFVHCPVLTVPTDSLNFAQNAAHLDLVISKITDKLQGQEVVEFPPS